MFTPEDREEVRRALEHRAREDQRVAAAALVGSLAVGEADAWSDVDFALAVDDDVPHLEVLDDWSSWLAQERGAVVLLDWPVPPAVYRVLLLPGGLQVDLSTTPAADFTRRSPRFRLLFGTHLTEETTEPTAWDSFARAVLFAVETQRDIARGRHWQGLHFLGQVRDHVLALAAANRGLTTRNARAADRLPPDVLAAASATLATSVDAESLRRALRACLELLRTESSDLDGAAAFAEVLAGVAAEL